MRCKWYQSHDWEKVKVRTTKNFLGESISKLEFTKYRVCKKCKSVQEYMYDSQGGTNYYLDKEEAEVLLKKIDRDYVLHVTIGAPGHD